MYRPSYSDGLWPNESSYNTNSQLTTTTRCPDDVKNREPMYQMMAPYPVFYGIPYPVPPPDTTPQYGEMAPYQTPQEDDLESIDIEERVVVMTPDPTMAPYPDSYDMPYPTPQYVEMVPYPMVPEKPTRSLKKTAELDMAPYRKPYPKTQEDDLESIDKPRAQDDSKTPHDPSDPLNAPTPNYIDTKHLCDTVWFLLKKHSISQTLFAHVVARRRQGTMSDLLRNPRCWFEMKSGRDVYRRMYNWVRMKEHERLEILDRDTTPPSPPKKKEAEPKARHTFKPEEKAMLQGVFAKNEKPSEAEMKEIAKQLGVKYHNIRIYFTNARRRKSHVTRRAIKYSNN